MHFLKTKLKLRMECKILGRGAPQRENSVALRNSVALIFLSAALSGLVVSV